jgi:RNA polymerase sigma factor (sigma-70 family)
MGPADTDTLVALNDPVLTPLLRAEGDLITPELERLVMEVARPIVDTIVWRYSRFGAAFLTELEDLVSSITLRLISKLSRIKRDSDEAISDFPGYVATVTTNAVHDYLRRRFPERARLKNQLRYLLGHDDRFETWIIGGESVCALRGMPRTTPAIADVARLRDVTTVMHDAKNPADSLSAVLAGIGRPAWLNDVVTIVAELWNVAEVRSVDTTFPIIAADSTTPVRLETRELVESLWNEVKILRPLQRKALLLNLRDGETLNVLSLLVWSGIASYDEIAAALDISAEALAAVWNDLPLQDTQIAEMLGVSRQQVINLRKAARARLRRRVGR